MGYFRLVLSIMVCMNHLWIIGAVGRFAVFGFYILSGYLMTTVIIERYGLSRNGLIKYSINRLLRIYPLYLISLSITVITLVVFDTSDIASFSPNIEMPSTIKSWLMNITLIGLDFSVYTRLIPQSWTLFVEIFFYAFIPIALIFGRRFIFIWVISSMLYHAYFIITSDNLNANWNDRYGTVMAGSLGFSIGCAIRYYNFSFIKNKSLFFFSIFSLSFCYLLTSLHMIYNLGYIVNFLIPTVIFYLTMILSAILIINIVNITPGKLSRISGNLSYPVYLIHITAGFIVFKLFDLHQRSLYVLALGLILSLFISSIMIFADRVINKIRNKIKSTI